MTQENKTKVLAMWQEKSKNGNVYFTGKTEDGKKLVGFYNLAAQKKNPKEPDIRIYEHKEKLEKPFLSVWVNVSKSGKKYLVGLMENKKVVGFVNEPKEGKKVPYFTIYKSNEGFTKEENKQAKKQQENINVENNGLPI